VQPVITFVSDDADDLSPGILLALPDPLADSVRRTIAAHRHLQSVRRIDCVDP
jgi:hypothetical protein